MPVRETTAPKGGRSAQLGFVGELCDVGRVLELDFDGADGAGKWTI